MTAYYNENDKYCAQWLRNLIAAGHIAPGDVDERSIVDVRPDDLRGYVQCHFFAGIGGWSVALRLAWCEEQFDIDACENRKHCKLERKATAEARKLRRRPKNIAMPAKTGD